MRVRTWLMLAGLSLCACTEDPLVLEITTTSLPEGLVGTTYGAQLSARGGTDGGYDWTVTQGVLPTGIVLSKSGALSGVPEEAGSFVFGARVVDTALAQTEKTITFVVQDDLTQLQVLTEALPAAMVGDAYAVSIDGRGGSGTYAWNVTSGRLPNGLALGALGTPSTQLRGVPFESGSFPVTIRVADEAGETADQNLTLSVTAGAIEIVTTSLPSAVVGVPYEGIVVGRRGASGGQGGYLWSATDLPPGLSIETAGTPSTLITGTPTAFGSYSTTITVVDETATSVDKVLVIEVLENVVPLTITTATLADAIVCRPYRQSIVAIGGSGADYRWRVTGGALPAGVVLEPTGTPSTVLSGSATTVGDTRFTIEVEDGAGNTASAALTVAAANTMPPARRWAAIRGEIFVAGRNELGMLDLCGDAAPVRPHPSTALGGLAATGGPIAFAPNESWLAYAGNFTTNDNTDLYVLPIGGGVLGTAIDITSASGGKWRAMFWAPDGQQLAFSSDPEISGKAELYLVDVRMPQVITKISAPMGATSDIVSNGVVFSPDGTKLLYLADADINSQYELFVVDLAGPGTGVKISPQVVTSGDVRSNFKFTPDSAGVVMDADAFVDSVHDLFWVDVSGATPTTPLRLNVRNSPTGETRAFAISKNGVLVYVADTVVVGKDELRVVQLASGTPTAPVSAASGQIDNGDVKDFVWSPTGDHVAATGDLETNEVNELFLLDASAGFPQALTKVSGPMVLGGRVRTASTSPSILFSDDGRWLAYIADQDFDEGDDVYLVDLSGAAPSAARRVTNVGTPGLGALHMTFSPDGGRLAIQGAFRSRDVVELYVVDLANAGSAVRVSPDLPAGASLDRRRESLAFSRDGQSLFFLGELDAAGRMEAYRSDLGLPGAPTNRISPVLPNGGSVGDLVLAR